MARNESQVELEMWRDMHPIGELVYRLISGATEDSFVAGSRRFALALSFCTIASCTHKRLLCAWAKQHPFGGTIGDGVL